MVKKMVLVLVCIAGLLFMVGCGNGTLETANEDEITIEVVNNTENIIVSFALFYGPGFDEWGEELLGDEVIEPGETVSFVLPDGIYRIIPMTYEYYVLPIVSDIDGDYRHEIGGEGKVAILVTNETDDFIGSLYFSPSVSDDWGEDLLGGEAIPVGISYFLFVEPNTYDILVTDRTGENVWREENLLIDGERHITVE